MLPVVLLRPAAKLYAAHVAVGVVVALQFQGLQLGPCRGVLHCRCRLKSATGGGYGQCSECCRQCLCTATRINFCLWRCFSETGRSMCLHSAHICSVLLMLVVSLLSGVGDGGIAFFASLAPPLHSLWLRPQRERDSAEPAHCCVQLLPACGWI